MKLADENDTNKMRDLLVKVRGMKQEAGKSKKDVAALESAIVTLKKKKRKSV